MPTLWLRGGRRVNTAGKGRRNEHRSRDLLKALGYRVLRSAGSLGAFDLLGLSATDLVAVQVKTNRPPSALELRELAEYPVPPHCRKLVHVWKDRQRLPLVQEL